MAPDIPSMSSKEARSADPAGALALPARRALRFLQWLDGFLSEELRRSPPGELSRSRVLAGTAIALVLVNSVVTGAILLTGLPWIYAVGGSTTLAGYVGTLWMLRRASSSRPAALLLSGIMASGVSLTA